MSKIEKMDYSGGTAIINEMGRDTVEVYGSSESYEIDNEPDFTITIDDNGIDILPRL